MGKKKREALTVQRLINEVLVSQLSIPVRQIVNDTTFVKFTGLERPDLLISEVPFNGSNEEEFIDNLVAYAELKDNCSFNDKDWKDAKKQAKKKSKGLGMPFFIVSNCKTSIFYNAETGEELSLNRNPIREFQSIDIYRILKSKLRTDKSIKNINTNVDSISAVSEAIFNKKLWELKNIYRGISFKNNIQKIDFTIGFVSLEYFEEKEILDGKINHSKVYWSDCIADKSEQVVSNLSGYVSRLQRDTDFKEFRNLIDTVKIAISGNSTKKPIFPAKEVKKIYEIIDSMKPLHGCGFDLFGAVYEMFANTNEKKEFGEFFTRRHYAHILAKLLLKDENYFNKEQKFKLIDPACGTGGFLTEAFKVLQNNYLKSDTYNKKAETFLSKDAIHGFDIREENILRTKLNMFLVGDGHTNMQDGDSLNMSYDDLYKYVITNPPYGNGSIQAELDRFHTKRMEIAFLAKIIKALIIGGRACVIIPDGVLENPSYKEVRQELLEKCTVTAIISLPKFAFAPYTKEKTYAVFFTKRSGNITSLQKENVWMYIIDNDGLANSDKRFPTKKRNNKNGWSHDEISGWVSTDGVEMSGVLEDRFMKFSDERENGTTWIDETGKKRFDRKGGFVNISQIKEDRFLTLLPEYYLRPYQPNYIEFDQFKKEVDQLVNNLKVDLDEN